MHLFLQNELCTPIIKWHWESLPIEVFCRRVGLDATWNLAKFLLFASIFFMEKELRSINDDQSLFSMNLTCDWGTKIVWSILKNWNFEMGYDVYPIHVLYLYEVTFSSGSHQIQKQVRNQNYILIKLHVKSSQDDLGRIQTCSLTKRNQANSQNKIHFHKHFELIYLCSRRDNPLRYKSFHFFWGHMNGS